MHRALYVCPVAAPSPEPLLDSLTRRAAFALARCRLGRGWRGVHQCSCGSVSSCTDHILLAVVGEIETHSLLVHYLAHHREELPEVELDALRLLLPADEQDPTHLMLDGWRYGVPSAMNSERWYGGADAHLVEWPSRAPRHPVRYR